MSRDYGIRDCKVVGCDRPHHAKGYCRNHYRATRDKSDHDSFARSSASRAWQAALDANHRIEEILDKLSRIEASPTLARRMYRCQWCGAWSTAPSCPEHLDLMDTAALLEETLGGA